MILCVRRGGVSGFVGFSLLLLNYIYILCYNISHKLLTQGANFCMSYIDMDFKLRNQALQETQVNNFLIQFKRWRGKKTLKSFGNII